MGWSSARRPSSCRRSTAAATKLLVMLAVRKPALPWGKGTPGLVGPITIVVASPDALRVLSTSGAVAGWAPSTATMASRRQASPAVAAELPSSSTRKRTGRMAVPDDGGARFWNAARAGSGAVGHARRASPSSGGIRASAGAHAACPAPRDAQSTACARASSSARSSASSAAMASLRSCTKRSATPRCTAAELLLKWTSSPLRLTRPRSA